MSLLTIYGHSFSYYYQSLIVPISIFIPIGVAVYNYRYINRLFKVLLLYLLVSGSINLMAILQSGNNNLPLLHIYTVVEFLFLAVYFVGLNQSRSFRKYSYLIMAVFPVLCLINVLFFQSKYQFNSYVRPLEALIFICYSLLYFFNSVDTDTSQSWTNNGFNLINAGLLLYFSGSLFVFILSNVITFKLSHDAKMLIWNLHDTFVIVLYLVMAFGFIKWKTSTKIYMS
ncbi:hypothetical protein EZ428_12245 [Pedobacter frigiditerrae]|uniref:Uncharacterized protein n=1 Tax=Pedobacter frigiditerrae TaxID=2530452 RepID=A0A4R0MTD3_9SPHI|nr:hypothetical protein [Pedobacter frigiditerrae]TCC90053.1 hypothetical protein EZ428_12245 [Pedobacter frigiditerrae]